MQKWKLAEDCVKKVAKRIPEVGEAWMVGNSDYQIMIRIPDELGEKVLPITKGKKDVFYSMDDQGAVLWMSKSDVDDVTLLNVSFSRK